jgi:hypothetical protein
MNLGLTHRSPGYPACRPLLRPLATMTGNSSGVTVEVSARAGFLSVLGHRRAHQRVVNAFDDVEEDACELGVLKEYEASRLKMSTEGASDGRGSRVRNPQALVNSWRSRLRNVGRVIVRPEPSLNRGHGWSESKPEARLSSVLAELDGPRWRACPAEPP